MSLSPFSLLCLFLLVVLGVSVDVRAATITTGVKVSVTSNANPTLPGDKVTFTATITTDDGNNTPVAAGSFRFSIGGTPKTLYTITAGMNGVVNYQVQLDTATRYSITWSYTGATATVGSDTVTYTSKTTPVGAAFIQFVNNPTVLDLASLVTAPVVVQTGQAYTLEATLSSDPAITGDAVALVEATGTVTFYVDGVALTGDCAAASLNLAIASCSYTWTSPTAPNEAVITAIYNAEDDRFRSSTSNSVKHIVYFRQPVIIELTNPTENGIGVVNEAIKFTATIYKKNDDGSKGAIIGTTKGRVDYTASTATVAKQSKVVVEDFGLSYVTYTWTTPNYDSNGVEAIFNRLDAGDTGEFFDPYYGEASTYLTPVIIAPPTTTTVSSNINPQSYNTDVIFTATIKTNGGSGSIWNPVSGITTGKVTFYKPDPNDATQKVIITGCSSVTVSTGVNPGRAQCTTKFAENGMYPITASYTGDKLGYKSETTVDFNQYISFPTSTTVTSDVQQVIVNTEVTFTAHIVTTHNNADVPASTTGKVRFSVQGDNTYLCEGVAVGADGLAVCKYTFDSAGVRYIVAEYNYNVGGVAPEKLYSASNNNLSPYKQIISVETVTEVQPWDFYLDTDVAYTISSIVKDKVLDVNIGNTVGTALFKIRKDGEQLADIVGCTTSEVDGGETVCEPYTWAEAGIYYIQTIFSGDEAYYTSTSAELKVQVYDRKETIVVIDCDTKPATVNEVYPYTFTVHRYYPLTQETGAVIGVTTGKLKSFVNKLTAQGGVIVGDCVTPNTQLGSDVVDAVVTCDIKFTETGTDRRIDATFNEGTMAQTDPEYLTGTGFNTFVVSPPSVTTTSSDDQVVNRGVQVTLYAHITNKDTGANVPPAVAGTSTGTVDIWIESDQNLLGDSCKNLAVVDGLASCTHTFAVAGKYEVMAKFTGDQYGGKSQTASDHPKDIYSYIQYITIPVTLTISSDENPSDTATAVTFTADLIDADLNQVVTSQGKVRFFIDNTMIADCTAQAVADSKATCKHTFPEFGTYTVRAEFNWEDPDSTPIANFPADTKYGTDDDSMQEKIKMATDCAINGVAGDDSSPYDPVPTETNFVINGHVFKRATTTHIGANVGQVSFFYTDKDGVLHNVTNCFALPNSAGPADCSTEFQLSGFYDVWMEYSGDDTHTVCDSKNDKILLKVLGKTVVEISAGQSLLSTNALNKLTAVVKEVSNHGQTRTAITSFGGKVTFQRAKYTDGDVYADTHTYGAYVDIAECVDVELGTDNIAECETKSKPRGFYSVVAKYSGETDLYTPGQVELGFDAQYETRQATKTSVFTKNSPSYSVSKN